MIYVLSGKNSFLLNERKKSLITEFVRKYGDLALEKIDGEETDIDRIRESLESLPFLSPKKLVVLTSPSLNKDFMNDYKELLNEAPETTDVIIIEPKLDKRSGFYKYAKKLPGFNEFSDLDTAGLTRWSQDYVKKWDSKIDTIAARELIRRVGADQMNLKNELDKLAMYDDKITSDSVQNLTVATPASSIFELLDAALGGNQKRTIALYEEQRMLNVDPLKIIGMLAWQFHVLAIVKTAGNKSSQEIAREAKLNPFVVQKSQSAARKLSQQRIRELVSELRAMDEKLKRVKINPDDALQAFLLSI